MNSSEPYTLLESISLRYEELKDSGVPVEQRFPELKSYIVDLLDVVKEYQLLTLDQFIYAAFIAANNVQDVRLYSLEASLATLKDKQIGLGQLVLEIMFIAMIDVGMVAVGGELLIAALPAVGALLYRMAQRQRIEARVGQVVASVEQAVILKGQTVEAKQIVEGWMDPPFPMGLFPRTDTVPPPPSIEEGMSIVSRIKANPLEDLEGQITLKEFQLRQLRAERAMLPVKERLVRTGTSRALQERYARYRQLRGPDTLSQSLSALRNQFTAQLGAAAPASDDAEKYNHRLMPSSAIIDLIAELQAMKIPLINETAYAKSAIRRHPEERTFFVNIEVAQIVNELNELYPRIIYAYDNLLHSTREIADRIEIGIWYVYLWANDILNVGQVNEHFTLRRNTDGVFHKGIILATQEPKTVYGSIARTILGFKVTGDVYSGIDKITEDQAQHLFRRFAVPQLKTIKSVLARYVVSQAVGGGAGDASQRLGELVNPELYAAVDRPERSSLGLWDYERDRQVRTLKLCVIVFFRLFGERLETQGIRSEQFGKEMVGQPFKNVLDLLKPPEPKESPPPSTDAPADDPLQQALKDVGFQMKNEVTAELLLLQTELRLLRLPAAEASEWDLLKRQMCEEISELLSQLQGLELTSEQKERALKLEQEYSGSVCNRVT